MSTHACIHCHSALSYIDYNRSPYCRQPNCQRALAQIVTAEKQSKQEALYRKISAQCEEQVKDLLKFPTYEQIPLELLESIQINTPVVTLLPVNKNVITESSEQRKEAFLMHLVALFNDIKSGGEMPLKIYNDELEEPLPEEESALLGHACATCKGYCCGLGGTHGFQDYPSLEHYLSNQPADISEDELKERYRSYLPSMSYRDACVFQGNQGCTLPREMRSFTCNNYRCVKLTDYRKQVASSDSKLTYAVAVDHEKIIGTSVFNAEHFARHR